MLCKLDLNISDEILQNVVRCQPGVIEYILHHIMIRVCCLCGVMLENTSYREHFPPYSQIESLQQQQSTTSCTSQILSQYGGAMPAAYASSEAYALTEQVWRLGKTT